MADRAPDNPSHNRTGEPREAGQPAADAGEFSIPPAIFTKTLDDAECLLNYAAAAGIEVSPDITGAVLLARSRATEGARYSQSVADNLLKARARLARDLYPATAEGIRSPGILADRAIKWLSRSAVILLVIIASLSAFAFLASQTSILITTDINEVNQKWMNLMSASPNDAADATKADATLGLLMQREQIVTGMRSIYEKAYLFRIADPATWFRPFADQAEKLKALTKQDDVDGDLRKTTDKFYHETAEIRYFGLKLVDDVTLYNGLLTNAILPVLYALFGACAYQLVGTFAAIRDRRFVRARAYFGRYALAGIAGEVIGLFNFTIAQPVSVSPLALAFLVGYGADAFFALLQTIVANLTMNLPGAAASQGFRAPPPAPLSSTGYDGATGLATRGQPANPGPATDNPDPASTR